MIRCAALLAILLSPSLARAEPVPYASAQHAAVELQLGPYRPDVDDELSPAHPFQDSFGTDSSVRFGLQVDWQLARLWCCSFGLGASIGMATFSGKGRLADTGDDSSEETTFTVLPLVASAVVRLDGPMRQWSIPVVPFARAGVVRASWWSEGGGGISSADDVQARGHTWGFELSAGVAVLLDGIDPDRARALDQDVGINHSYLTFAALVDAVDLGGDVMILSDTSWTAGLLLEL